MSKIWMKAPKGTSSATIDGQEYEIPKSGKIQVKQESHLATLKLHGFVETDEDGEPDFDAMEDEELVKFIEERGNEASLKMSNKKLKRLAREAWAESQED